MRRSRGSSILGLLCALSLTSGAVAQVAPTPPPRTVVYLYGATDLEHLRESHFSHYLRATKILAAANEICRPGKETTTFTRFDGADPRCDAMLWKTSNPPKKQLRFRLDEVLYVALVTVTEGQARLIPAH